MNFFKYLAIGFFIFFMASVLSLMICEIIKDLEFSNSSVYIALLAKQFADIYIVVNLSLAVICSFIYGSFNLVKFFKEN